MVPWWVVGVALAAEPAADEIARLHLAEGGSAPLGEPVLQSTRTFRGREWVRFRQHVGGVPVEGGLRVVKVDGGRVVAEAGSFRPIRGQAPGVAAAAAAERARAAVAPGATSSDPELWYDASGRLVWRIDVVGGRTDHRQVSVDATTGLVVRVRALGRTADGMAYPTNMGEDLSVVPLDGLPPGASVLDAPSALVRTMTFGALGNEAAHVATADSNGDFLHEPLEVVEDAFAEVNAFHHVDAVSAWYGARFGYTFADPADVLVSYRDADDGVYDNAYFAYAGDGSYTLTMGEGSVYDFAHDPDVLVHEFSHGVLEDLVGLMSEMSYPVNVDAYGLHVAPGALTEGIPDYFAVTRFDDPNMGTSFSGVGPLRDLDNDKAVPGDILGEAHADGEVLGGTLWEIRTRVGADASDAMVWSMLLGLSTSPTFEDVSTGLLAAADDLVTDGVLTGEDRDAVEVILAERGLLHTGRAYDLGTGGTATNLWLGADILDASLCPFMRALEVKLTPPFQYVVTAPEGATVEGLEVSVTLDGDTSDVDYVLVVKKGDLVAFETTIFDLGTPFEIPIGVEAVDAEVASDGSTASLSLGPDDLDLEAGVPYYVALLGMNCASTQATVTAALTYEGGETETETESEIEDTDPANSEPTETGTPVGGETGAGSPKGCGCASGGGGAIAWPAVGLVWIASRRRRDGAPERPVDRM